MHLIERTSSILDKIESKTGHKYKGKRYRNRKKSEVKLVKNISKNP